MSFLTLIRSLAIVKSRLPNYLLAVVIGCHGAGSSSTRLLSPLDDIEFNVMRTRTLEIGVDYFFKPVKNVRKITRRIQHAKFYILQIKTISFHITIFIYDTISCFKSTTSMLPHRGVTAKGFTRKGCA